MLGQGERRVSLVPSQAHEVEFGADGADGAETIRLGKLNR